MLHLYFEVIAINMRSEMSKTCKVSLSCKISELRFLNIYFKFDGARVYAKFYNKKKKSHKHCALMEVLALRVVWVMKQPHQCGLLH